MDWPGVHYRTSSLLGLFDISSTGSPDRNRSVNAEGSIAIEVVRSEMLASCTSPRTIFPADLPRLGHTYGIEIGSDESRDAEMMSRSDKGRDMKGAARLSSDLAEAATAGVIRALVDHL
jgi:hypothetical protein